MLFQLKLLFFLRAEPMLFVSILRSLKFLRIRFLPRKFDLHFPKMNKFDKNRINNQKLAEICMKWAKNSKHNRLNSTKIAEIAKIGQVSQKNAKNVIFDKNRLNSTKIKNNGRNC